MIEGQETVRRGAIYREIYAKRKDERVATHDADVVAAWVDNNDLRFSSSAERDRAFGDGVFMLRIPDGLDLSVGDTFAREFFKGDAAGGYGRFRALGPDIFGDPLLGFHQRTNQIEQFLLERRYWNSYYPPEILALGEALTLLCTRVLRCVLAHVGIPSEIWQRATGGCSATEGSYHLTFNHYRPEHSGCGLSSHKDDGFLTILRTNAGGLEVNRRDTWERVPTNPAHLIVNFGLAMEILTARTRAPLAAIMHRVSHQTDHRSSFGHFSSSCCLPGSDQGIYRYEEGLGLERVCASRELIDNNDYEIYAGTDAPKEQAS